MTENKIIRDNMPLVSVIVPIYNVELYLKECVDSIPVSYTHLDNREWWETIISGEYQNYYEKMYSNR